MSEQKTRCPHCHTTFRVNQSHLEAASGMVRCGKCYQAFNGQACLLRLPGAVHPPQPISPQPLTGVDDDDFLIDDNFDISRLEGAGRGETTHSAPAPTLRPGAATSSSVGEAAPEAVIFTAGSPVPAPREELATLKLDQRDMTRWRPETHNIIPDAGLIGRRRASRRGPFAWLWLLGSLLAAVALLVQVAYFNSLAVDRASPLWPMTSTLCEALGCPLARPVDLDRILSTNLVIRNHPYTENALLVDAVIVNTAEFDQPFPPLTLAFEDLQGELVARRTFSPRDYLQGELDGLMEMPAQKPVKLELEIVDPGRDAVSFQFFIAK